MLNPEEDAIIVLSIHNRHPWLRGTFHASQHVFISRQVLGDIFRRLTCPNCTALAQEEPQAANRLFYKPKRSDSGKDFICCIDNTLYGSVDDDADNYPRSIEPRSCDIALTLG